MTIQERANRWIVGRDTGLSSKTIWAVMMGVKDCCSVPLDADDFGRCYRLLALIPEWRERLVEMGEAFPDWVPLAREWDKLEEMYLQENNKGMYDFMETLREEGMLLAGWIKEGPGCWRKGKSQEVEIGHGMSISIRCARG